MLSDPKIIIKKLKEYKKKIDDMDYKVRMYLSDRQRYPYPGHVELIHEIRAFETRLYGKRFGFANTEIELRLDGLMYSLMIYERHWKSLFEEDEMAQHRSTLTSQNNPLTSANSDALIDKLYHQMEKKCHEKGISIIESRDEFLKRIKPAYEAAVSRSGKDPFVKFVWNKDQDRMEIDLGSLDKS